MSSLAPDLQATGLPRLTAFYFFPGDPNSNPTKADLPNSIFDDPDNDMQDWLDIGIAAGIKRWMFGWAVGRFPLESDTSVSGMYSLTYPDVNAPYGVGSLCEPITEVAHERIVGDRAYLTRLIAAVDTPARLGAMIDLRLNYGAVEANSPIDNTTLDSYLTVPVALGAGVHWDARTVLDYPNDICTPELFAGNLKLWVESHRYVYSDAGSTPAVNDATVQRWDVNSDNLDRLVAITTALVQNTGAARPVFKTNQINSLGAVQFNGSSQFMSMTATGALSAFVILAVLKCSSADQVLLSTPTTSKHVRFNQASGTVTVFDGTNTVQTNTGFWTADTWAMLKITFDGTTCRIYRNGVEASSYTSGPTGLASNLSFTNVGRNLVTNSLYFNGQLAALVISTSASHSNAIGLVEKYLALKYGLTITATATLPQKAIESRVVALLGRHSGSEGWERNDVVGMFSWVETSSVLQGDTTRKTLTDTDPETWFSKEQIKSVGSRPEIYIHFSVGTPQVRADVAGEIMREGLDALVNVNGFDADDYVYLRIVELRALASRRALLLMI